MASAQNKQQPNILLIMADDMGFSDIGSYGSEIHTPNIDRLAAEGTSFKRFYNNAICAPSRASLLTGQYPHKAGIGFFNKDLGIKGYEGYLNKESLTLGEVFKNGGYATYMSGKWHVGNDKEHWPLQRGFDKFYGFLDGAHSFWDDKPIMLGPPNSTKMFLNNEIAPIESEDFYLTDALTDKALDFLKETPKKQPFFMYMAYNSPHWPLHAKPEDIERYKGKYGIGWDSLRLARFERLKKLGLVNSDWNPVKDNSLTPWKKMTYDEKIVWEKKMEVYAAMVDNLDQNIGRLLEYLESTGQLDNTLVIFLSDNGAEDWDFSKHPISINRSNGTVGTVGSNESYTKNWAQASNMPLRSYKSSPYEGGTSTPFIMRYPKSVPAGKIQKGGAHIVDIMPTLMEFTGVKYPKDYEGHDINAPVGLSFMDAMVQAEWKREKPICFEWSGKRGVWYKNWKAVSLYPENVWQLYDLDADRTESMDVAKEHPEVLEKIDQIYNEWAAQNQVATWSEEMIKRSGFTKKN
ncbi:arylsulfatase [Muricauda sp. NBRC 101325]|nr:arylsulfatase [Muricauda sp. NBRC 101325]